MSENNSVLVTVFGDVPLIKIMDTFLDHPNYEYTTNELAEVNNIARSTVYNVLDKLKGLDFVEQTRKAGNAKMYKLNEDSKVAKELYNFGDNLSDFLGDEE